MFQQFKEIKQIEERFNFNNDNILIVQNIDAIRVEIKGSVDNQNFFSIGGTNLKDGNFISEIKEPGLFQFNIKGIPFIKIIKNETKVKVTMISAE